MILALNTGFRDERGAIALIAAISMTTVLGFAALAVDLGSLYAAKRHLQGATDAAALSATYPIAQGSSTTPASIAGTYLAKNISGATLVSAVSGTYCPDTGIVSQSGRFLAGANQTCPDNTEIAGLNAVKVISKISSPLFFGRVFSSVAASETIQVSATAAQINEAGFYAGTGLVNINAGAINAVLNGVLPGSNISLSAASYQALANADIDALTFFNALATNVGVTAGTYDSVLQSSATVQNVLQSEIDVLNGQGNVANATAITALTSLKSSIVGSPAVNLSSLFDLGVWQNVGLGSSTSSGALSATLNAFQLASLTAQVANGTHAVTISPTSLGISGVATLTAASTVIEPPQGPAFVFGPVGVTAHTAQVRLQLNLQLLSALSLGGLLGTAPVNLPIYVEVASGDAKSTNINCGYTPATDATVTISGQSGLASAYVGSVSSTAMSNVSTPVTVTPATLVNVASIVQITGSAQASISGATSSLTFNQTEIANLTPQIVTSNATLTTSLLQSLGSSLTLSGKLLGVTISANSSLFTSLTTLLTPVFAGLDAVVDSMLAALGINVGYMDVTATGIRCGAPTLVD